MLELKEQQQAKSSGDDFPTVDVRLANIVGKLAGVHKRANGQYEALCPAHDDTRPSLGVRIGDNGGIVLTCSKGCPKSLVLSTIGYNLAYLRPDGETRPIYPGPGPGNGNGHSAGKIAATYDYRDTDGSLLFQVVRYDPKDFRQRKPDGAGGWSWSVKGTKTVIYRLPEITAADPLKTVYVVEGEKDADRLAAAGLLATCNPMGASKGGGCKWTADHSAYLKGRHVVIIPDNDNAGRDHANGIAKSLSGIAASVKILQLEGLPEKGDVSDWFDLGNTVERLQQLAIGAPSAEKKIEPVKVIPSAEFFATSFQREYLVEGVLTKGEPCIVGGRSKTLKTSITIDLVLALGCGGKFMGRFNAQPRRVAILSGESGDYTIQDTARRIAQARGYDPYKANVFWGFDLPCLGSDEDLAALEATIREHQIEVLAVDPVYLSLMGEATQGLNASNLFDVGPLLLRIAKLCKSTETTLILLHHCRKNSPNEKYDPPELEELSMSGFGEFARQWILIGRREPYAFDGFHRLWVSVGGSAGHSGCWALDVNEGHPEADGGRLWETVLTTKAEIDGADEAVKESKAGEKRNQKDERDKATLLRVLANYPGGETKTLLRGKAKLGVPRFREVASLLEDEGKVEQCQIVKNKRTENGLRLVVVSEFSEFSATNLDAAEAGRPVDQNAISVDRSGGVAEGLVDRSTGTNQTGVCNTPVGRAVGRPADSATGDRPTSDEATPACGSVESGGCPHEWAVEPSTLREGYFKKQCKKCNELFGYLTAAEAGREGGNG